MGSGSALLDLTTSFQDVSNLGTNREICVVKSVAGLIVAIEAGEALAATDGIEIGRVIGDRVFAIPTNSSVYLRYRVAGGSLGPSTKIYLTGGGSGGGGGGSSGAATQATWFIDPVAGNDAASGLTPSTAIKTWTEWKRRIGDQEINVSTAVSFLSDLLAGDAPTGTVHVGPLGSIRFHGTPTVVYASTGAGVTVVAVNHAANTGWLLTDTNLPQANWSAWLADGASSPFRIKLGLGSSHPGAIVWPQKEIAGKQARFLTPMIPNPALGCFGQSTTTMATLDPFNLEQLTQLGSPSLNWQISAVPLVSGIEHVTFSDCAFGVTEGAMMTNDIGFGTQLGFYACDLGLMAIGGGGADFLDCRWGQLFTDSNGYYYLFGGGCCGPCSIQNTIGVNIDFEWGMQGHLLNLYGSAGFIGAFQSYDWPGGGALQVQGARIVLQTIFAPRFVFGLSAVALTEGIRVQNGGTVAYDNVTGLSITGTTGNTTLGTPATTKAYGALPFVDANTAAIVVL